jgi:hypothetical protein
MTPSFKQVFLFALVAVLTVTADLYGQSAGKDNLGKEFFVGFAANQGAGSDFNNDDTTVFALYLTGPVAAKGYVEVPAIGFSVNFTTTPGQITTIYLPDGDGSSGQSVEVLTSEVPVPGMGVHVVADTEIAVYGMSHKRYSSDAFMAMPIDVLGTEYRAICYPTSLLQNFSSSDTPGEFWIVAVNDSTNVSITPAARTSTNRPAAQRFDILLNRGDMYLVQGDRNDPANDLTGSLIEAELPIAVFSGHERTEIPKGVRNLDPNDPSEFQQTSRDHLIEQVPPVSAWGDSALVIPFATSDNPDLVRIVSAEDGNTVWINGTMNVKLDAGKFYEIKALSGPTSISATNPILVGQYMHTSKFGLDNTGDINPDNPAYGDPALALVYPVEQFAKSYTFISVVNSRAFLGNFVNVVVEQAGVSSMKLDGVTIPASEFKAIPGSSFVYAQLKLTQGTHNISGNSPSGITVYAMGGVDSYAYTGGTLLKTITPFKTVDLIIDFGDRPLEEGTLAGSWDTTVYLQNISSDPLTISSYFPRTGDVTKFKVLDPTPVILTAGQKGSMTIQFEPREADRRMHTIIQAKTEHLRAFVVDVYGRGVLARPNTFATPTSTVPIDTIDFGILGENSPPADTLAYIINNGSADLTVDSLTITGPDAADFSFLGARINALPAALPFMVPKASATAAQLGLRFTPSLPRAKRVAFLDYSSPTKQKRRVVLIARVDSIELASVTPVTFDSILICESDDGTFTIFNPNTFAVRLLRLDIFGPNASDFVVLNALPLDIPSNQTVTIRLRFAPNSPGLKTATATASFDIPTGGKRSFQIQAVAKQLQAAFWAPRELAILGNEEVLFPIYARSDLARYQSKSYIVDINYDPTFLEDVELVFDNTLNPFTYYEVEGYDPGLRKYICHTYDNNNLSGGGPTELKPLVYIKFKALLTASDMAHAYSEIDIHYKVSFTDSPLPTHCIASDPTAGRIIIDSACGPVHVEKQVGIPTETFMDYPSPNPVVNGSVALYLYLPHNSLARVDIINMLGTRVATVLEEQKEAGRYKVTYNTSQLPQGQYFLRLEAAGKVKTRRLSIVR